MRPFHMNNSSCHGQQRAPNTFQPPTHSPSYQQQGWGSGCTGGYYGNHGNSNHRNGTNSQNANSMNNNGYVPHPKNSEIDRNENCQSGNTYHHGNMGMYSPRDKYQGGNFVSKSFQNGNVNRSATSPWSNGQNYEQSPYKPNYDDQIKGSYSNNSDRGYGNNYFIDGGNNRNNNSHQSYFNKSQSWQNQTYQPNSTSSDTSYNKRNESVPTHFNKPSFNRGKPGREPGYQPQNHHQTKGGGQKKKKIDKRELPENNKFFCDTCDRGFPTEEKYTTHTNEHQQCSYEGCSYVAAPKLVQLHLRLQHINGMAKKIWSLESEEDIQKWKEERKKKFPTADNIAKKNSLIEERKARGEVLETKYFGKMKGKNYNKQTLGTHDNIDNTEDIEVQDKRNGRKRKRNRRKKFGQCMTEENEASETKIQRLDEPNYKTEGTPQDNETNLLTENSAIEESRLDNNSEVQKICRNTQGEACKVEKNTEGKCRNQIRNKNQQPRRNGRKGKNQEPKRKRFRGHPPTLLEKQRNCNLSTDSIPFAQGDLVICNMNCSIQFKQKEFLNNRILLANDIRHERNVILQCVNYIVKKNFLGIGQSTCDTSISTETSTSDRQTSSKTEPSTSDGPTSTKTEPSTSDGPTLTKTEPSTSDGPTSTKTEPSTSDGQSSSESIQTEPVTNENMLDKE